MKILAMLPTYNESGNISALIDDLLALDLPMEVLVVDDDSPDGTWKIVREKAERDKRVHLIHRTRERGRGTAGVVAFAFARDGGYDIAVEMDADFSHHPKFVPALVKPLIDDEADIVIGSRLIKDGGETGRHPVRGMITWGANLYIRSLLKLEPKDCTTGYRTFNRRALETLRWEQLRALGPEILQEVLLEARQARLRVVERPIHFEERRAGTSTFNWRIARRSIAWVWKNRRR